MELVYTSDLKSDAIRLAGSSPAPATNLYYEDIMSRINRGHQRREELREVAEENARERAKRTPQQQLDLLDKRLGKGIGAERERKHLQKLLGSSTKEAKEKAPNKAKSR